MFMRVSPYSPYVFNICKQTKWVILKRRWGQLCSCELNRIFATRLTMCDLQSFLKTTCSRSWLWQQVSAVSHLCSEHRRRLLVLTPLSQQLWTGGQGFLGSGPKCTPETWAGIRGRLGSIDGHHDRAEGIDEKMKEAEKKEKRQIEQGYGEEWILDSSLDWPADLGCI